LPIFTYARCFAVTLYVDIMRPRYATTAPAAFFACFAPCHAIHADVLCWRFHACLFLLPCPRCCYLFYVMPRYWGYQRGAFFIRHALYAVILSHLLTWYLIIAPYARVSSSLCLMLRDILCYSLAARRAADASCFFPRKSDLHYYFMPEACFTRCRHRHYIRYDVRSCCHCLPMICYMRDAILLFMLRCLSFWYTASLCCCYLIYVMPLRCFTISFFSIFHISYFAAFRHAIVFPFMHMPLFFAMPLRLAAWLFSAFHYRLMFFRHACHASSCCRYYPLLAIVDLRLPYYAISLSLPHYYVVDYAARFFHITLPLFHTLFFARRCFDFFILILLIMYFVIFAPCCLLITPMLTLHLRCYYAEVFIFSAVCSMFWVRAICWFIAIIFIMRDAVCCHALWWYRAIARWAPPCRADARLSPLPCLSYDMPRAQRATMLRYVSITPCLLLACWYYAMPLSLFCHYYYATDTIDAIVYLPYIYYAAIMPSIFAISFCYCLRCFAVAFLYAFALFFFFFFFFFFFSALRLLRYYSPYFAVSLPLSRFFRAISLLMFSLFRYFACRSLIYLLLPAPDMICLLYMLDAWYACCHYYYCCFSTMLMPFRYYLFLHTTLLFFYHIWYFAPCRRDAVGVIRRFASIRYYFRSMPFFAAFAIHSYVATLSFYYWYAIFAWYCCYFDLPLIAAALPDAPYARLAFCPCYADVYFHILLYILCSIIMLPLFFVDTPSRRATRHYYSTLFTPYARLCRYYFFAPYYYCWCWRWCLMLIPLILCLLPDYVS